MDRKCSPAALSDQPRSYREHYYETPDPMRLVRSPDYFAPVAETLRRGDLIRVRADTAGETAYDSLLVVSTDPGKGVVRTRSILAPVPVPAVAGRGGGRK
ncbi:MAG: hypothetical protein K8F57_01325 [Alphaproteobacteria bacterium]|nr:hypothetical protein [Alphaproteobacteria bacterium]